MTIELGATHAIPAGPTVPGSLGDMSDVIFAVAAYQLSGLDSDLASRIEGLKQLTAVKNAYRERIAALQEALKQMSDGGDHALVDAELTRRSDLGYDASSGGVVDHGSGYWSSGHVYTTRGGEDRAIVVPASGEDRAGTIARAQGVVDANPERYDGVMVSASRTEIETEISRLQSKLDELSGEGEIGLLAINRLLGKRTQVLQLASNVMSSAHQGAMGIIANIK
jgi:hypothetical protein